METEGKFKRCLKIVNDVLANATVGAGGVAAAAWLGDSSAGAKTLENAVAALEAAASQSSVEDSCQALPISGAVDALHALPAAVAALTSPHEDVFAALGGMPTEPQDEFAASAAANERRASAALLRLVLVLLRVQGSIQLLIDQQHSAGAAQHAVAANRSRHRSPSPVVCGIVEVHEEPASGAGGDPDTLHAAAVAAASRAAVLDVLLTSALYATACEPPPLPPPPFAAAGDAAVAGEALEELWCQRAAARAHGLHLETPWSDSVCSTCSTALLLHLGAAVTLQRVDGDSRTSSRTSSSSSRQPRAACQAVPAAALQPPAITAADCTDVATTASSWRMLLVALLPALLERLRPVLLAQHRFLRAQERGEMGTYDGPSVFARCCAARQLAWVAAALQPADGMPACAGQLLPLVLAVSDDPSPAVQRYGHAALASLGWCGVADPSAAAALQPFAPLLRDAMRRLVVGCESSCWGTAMMAATALALALDGRDVRGVSYHELISELLTEAERGVTDGQQRVVFIACAAWLLPAVGLHGLRHTSRLMPLLLEWALGVHEPVAAAGALRLLACALCATWPRARTHAAALTPQLAAAASTATAARAHDVRAAALIAAKVLDYACACSTV